MALRLEDKWVWDFWFAQDGSDYHVFYLQAPRVLKDERLRHWHTSIGHAISQDMITWQVLPDALKPSLGDDRAFDNYTTWTGSIIRNSGIWYMFYTGSNKVEGGHIQRIGLATSNDLVSWKKHPSNPLIEADARWYELLDLDIYHEQAWRDPWIFWHDGAYHALITGRANHGPVDRRGVIAHARSLDLIEWKVLPPLTEPGEFAQMEVPQIIAMNGGYYLIFSCGSGMLSSLGRNRYGDITGSYYLYGESPLGPFRYLCDQPLVGDKRGSYYSAKMIRGPDDTWYLFAFKNFDHNSNFIGEISDPMRVDVISNGRLKIMD